MHFWRHGWRGPLQWHLEDDQLEDGCMDLHVVGGYSALYRHHFWVLDGHYN
jgi:hypothetical protein